jgi:tRNA threonylcarbamoyladenosine modification (KEOPS) complex  Pcc1 subunit
MTGVPPEWSATVRVTVARPRDLVGWVARALAPEATRELRRAGASVRVSAPGTLEVVLEASDAGSMRAALNTYLGWVQLSLATARTAEAGAPAARRVGAPKRLSRRPGGTKRGATR